MRSELHFETSVGTSTWQMYLSTSTSILLLKYLSTSTSIILLKVLKYFFWFFTKYKYKYKYFDRRLNCSLGMEETVVNYSHQVYLLELKDLWTHIFICIIQFYFNVIILQQSFKSAFWAFNWMLSYFFYLIFIFIVNYCLLFCVVYSINL